MKNRTMMHFLITGLVFLSSQAFAQLPSIDSMKLIPANPTSNDLLKVVCFTTFPSGSCSLNQIHAEQQGNNILLMLDYNVGMATYICQSVDTIEIDNPGAGNFELITTLTRNGQDIIEDDYHLLFTIDPYLVTPEFASNYFRIYPNPVGNELKFNSNLKAEKLEIHAVSGQMIHSTEVLSGTFSVDISALEEGVYFVTLTDSQGNKAVQQIIKNETR